MAAKMIKLKSGSPNSEVFEVEVAVATKSKMIKDMLELMGDEEDVPIPLLNVNSETLKKVIEWATHHKDDPEVTDEEEEKKEKRTDDILPWDVNFLKVDQATLFNIILAANYLDMKGLLELTCKSVANMIKGKTPEEIRQSFHIKNDFTKDEEDQVRKENVWCEDR